ncbi:glycoside hydrolase family 32 protein [Alteribacter keqinensis]|uniref:Sucrose-6-phosphate hydrolase n=1 Tax=Alteribacter keqinensis TaxID=2483800 RepID=A0A3M7TW09_9BACI|nr:glycoside hydrolase family 32 protein [Alteribacter keqinensis]RNA69758.1 glycoside hydrolase family 32 protein [Alteribacter keqinensis]
MNTTTYSIEQANRFIKEKEEEVKNTKYRLGYHIAAPTGWINDPNGLVFFRGEYHVFYQYYPYEAEWGPMHWGHAKSKDLINWEALPVALAPEFDYEKGGCFSGSAVVFQDKLYLIYTGHNEEKNPKEVQCIAVSEDGIHFRKSESNPVIPSPPEDGSEDFRDPKVSFRDGKWHMVVGSGKDGKGKVLTFTSQDLETWHYEGVLLESDGEQGTMWECPDLFTIGEYDVLIFSPMEMEGSKTRYVIGKIDEQNKFNPINNDEIDFGPDFYAPQTFEDNKGRRLLISWMNMWKKEMPEKEDGWAGALTIPRELSIKDQKLIMTVPEEFKELRGNLLENSKGILQHDKMVKPLRNLCIEVHANISLKETDAEVIGLEVVSELEERFFIGYNRSYGNLIVDRTKMKKGDKDKVEVQYKKDNNINFEMYFDTSSVELFVDEGEKVLSHRIYFAGEHLNIRNLSANGMTDYHDLKIWQLNI